MIGLLIQTKMPAVITRPAPRRAQAPAPARCRAFAEPGRAVVGNDSVRPGGSMDSGDAMRGEF